ncbi:MAG: hypothetical protein M1832_000714 [Thelocarpon impressellum]|nr:MAG: hypothetical protein M1832_000714 [Thelocarpon impressellum]
MASPGSNATLTVRVVKSFAYRTSKNVVLHDVDLGETSVEALKSRVAAEMASKPGWKAYRDVKLDSMKLYSQPQGTKTMNLIINLDSDDRLFLAEDGRSLESYDIRHETEISFYNGDEYREFLKDPEQKW